MNLSGFLWFVTCSFKYHFDQDGSLSINDYLNHFVLILEDVFIIKYILHFSPIFVNR